MYGHRWPYISIILGIFLTLNLTIFIDALLCLYLLCIARNPLVILSTLLLLNFYVFFGLTIDPIITNALLLFNTISGKKMSLLEFRRALIVSSRKKYHNLVMTTEVEKEGSSRKMRSLLEQSSSARGRANACIKTSWRCQDCPSMPYVCPACFGHYHNSG